MRAGRLRGSFYDGGISCSPFYRGVRQFATAFPMNGSLRKVAGVLPPAPEAVFVSELCRFSLTRRFQLLASACFQIGVGSWRDSPAMRNARSCPRRIASLKFPTVGRFTTVRWYGLPPPVPELQTTTTLPVSGASGDAWFGEGALCTDACMSTA